MIWITLIRLAHPQGANGTPVSSIEIFIPSHLYPPIQGDALRDERKGS